MLVAGSEVVRLIHNKQGRQEAIAFAQHIVKIAGQQKQASLSQSQHFKQAPKAEMET